MATMIRGTDIPFDLKNLPEGAEIKRLDFAQNGVIVITKTGADFFIDGTTAYSVLTQDDTLKLNDKRTIEIQLSFYLNGLAKRTHITSIAPEKILYEGVI